MRSREIRTRQLAQASAEQLHRDTKALITICVAADLENDVIAVGAWCPNAKAAASVLRGIADRLDAGTADVIDHTKPENRT